MNYHILAVEKHRDSVFTTITTIWKPGLRPVNCIKTDIQNKSQRSHSSYRIKNKFPTAGYMNIFVPNCSAVIYVLGK